MNEPSPLSPPGPAVSQQMAWLATQCALVATGDATALALAFGQAGRRHHDPSAARIALVLAIPAAEPLRWLAVLDRLFATAGLAELIALYRGLPRYPHPALLRARAAVGVRSSMQSVFEAVALDNDYPTAWFEQDPLNQMVLKAFFLGCDHRRIKGLEARANPRLGRMLSDYRHERSAAGRTIPDGLAEVVAWCERD